MKAATLATPFVILHSGGGGLASIQPERDMIFRPPLPMPAPR